MIPPPELLSGTRTPFYAYDLSELAARYRKLRAALPEAVGVLYSLKANPHPRIIETLRKLGAGADVASLAELRAALSAGFAADRISFVGPGKNDDELRAAIDADLACVVVESLGELRRLEELARGTGRRARICLRIHPAEELGPGGKIRKSGPSQFGIDEEQWPDAIRVLRDTVAIDLVGLHFFVRSQLLSAHELLDHFARALAIGARLEHALGRPLPLINLGGGFGIPYFAGQSEPDLAGFSGKLGELLSAAPPRRYLVESGRFLSGPCGHFVTRVLYRKESRGKTILVCDGGLTQNLAATGMGQLLRRNFPVRAVRADGSAFPAEHARETVTITGPSCYGLDQIGVDVELPKADRGDLILIGQAGAYGYTFSPLKFLSQVDPLETCYEGCP